MKSFILRNLDKQKRLLPSFLPLNTLSYLPNTFHRNLQTPGLIDFALKLSSEASHAIVVYEDVTYVKKFPWLRLALPGKSYRMRTEEPWTVLVFSYAPDQLDTLKSLGIPLDLAGWEFEMTSELSIQIEEVLRKCEEIYMEGVLDHLDLMAFQIIRSILLNSQLQKFPEDPVRRRIRQAASFLQTHTNEKLVLDDIIAQFHFSRRTFFRCWKKEFSVSPIEYILAKRIENACSMLRSTEIRISEIADHLGFIDQSYFCRFFKQRTGKTPQEYRREILK